MFINLFRSELSRLRYRRRTYISLVLVLLVGLLTPFVWLSNLKKPDAEALREAKAQLHTAIAEGCSSCELDDFVWGYLDFSYLVRDGLAPTGLLFALATFLIVVAYVGADFASGSLATQLTFTPRRAPVLASRTVAAGVFGALLMALGMGTASGLTIVAYLATNGLASIGEAPGLLALLVSATLYGALLGMIASLLVFITFSTTYASAAAVVVLIIAGLAETLGGTSVGGWVYRMLPTRQGAALIEGSTAASFGPEWSQELIMHRPEGFLYHVLVIVLLALVAVPLFERRDVKG